MARSNWFILADGEDTLGDYAWDVLSDAQREYDRSNYLRRTYKPHELMIHEYNPHGQLVGKHPVQP